LGDINRGEWPEQFGDRPGNIFSYVMNNYWDTNYRAGQGGHFSFHYVVTSADATDAANLSRMGWEEITPLESDIITTQDKALGPVVDANPSTRLDSKQDSFLDVEDANLLLETWKPAEDGDGTILRFLDFGATDRLVTVGTPFQSLEDVSQTDALERGKMPLLVMGHNQFQVHVHPHEIITVRLAGGAK
jgi:alpha-mannosidase